MLTTRIDLHCELLFYATAVVMGALNSMLWFSLLLSRTPIIIHSLLISAHRIAELTWAAQTYFPNDLPYYVHTTSYATVTARGLRGLPSAGRHIPVMVVDTISNL